MPPLELTVTGMSCGGCSNAVKRVVEKLEGVDSCLADHQADKVTVDGNGYDEKLVRDAITNAGFAVQP